MTNQNMSIFVVVVAVALFPFCKHEIGVPKEARGRKTKRSNRKTKKKSQKSGDRYT